MWKKSGRGEGLDGGKFKAYLQLHIGHLRPVKYRTYNVQWLQCFNELKCTMLSRMYAPNVMEKDMQALEKVFRNEYIRPNYMFHCLPCNSIKIHFLVRAHAFWGKNPISSMRDTFIEAKQFLDSSRFSDSYRIHMLNMLSYATVIEYIVHSA